MSDFAPSNPKTLEGFKRLAKKIKKVQEVPHHEALDIAAKQAGFQNYNHARKSMS